MTSTQAMPAVAYRFLACLLYPKNATTSPELWSPPPEFVTPHVARTGPLASLPIVDLRQPMRF